MAKVVFVVEVGHGEKRKTSDGNESGRRGKWRLDRGTDEGRSRGV